MLNDPVVDVVRRELRRISPDVRLESDDIHQVIVDGVIKREALEGEGAEAANKRIEVAANTALRRRRTGGQTRLRSTNSRKRTRLRRPKS